MKDQLLSYHQREFRRDNPAPQQQSVIDLTQQAQATQSRQADSQTPQVAH